MQREGWQLVKGWGRGLAQTRRCTEGAGTRMLEEWSGRTEDLSGSIPWKEKSRVGLGREPPDHGEI